jgi:NAD(P)-dependent dehydrogenase (short-subunit alcohol dehydrogenase family)
VRGLRVLAEQLGDEGGALGLVLSSSARSPITGLGISNGLRPGLAMVCKDMADEYGPRGIRVLGLLPGRIATDRMRELDGADPAGRERVLATIPLGRYGRTDEIAALIGEGHDLATLSLRLGLGLGTARNHLKHVFEKTGVHSQANLVALVRSYREVQF